MELCRLVPEWLEVKDIGQSGRFLKLVNSGISGVRVHDVLKEKIIKSPVKVKN